MDSMEGVFCFSFSFEDLVYVFVVSYEELEAVKCSLVVKNEIEPLSLCIFPLCFSIGFNLA